MAEAQALRLEKMVVRTFKLNYWTLFQRHQEALEVPFFHFLFFFFFQEEEYGVQWITELGKAREILRYL